jgi:hypothetical protein
MDGDWTVYFGQGRVIARTSHLLSSYISFPADPGWRNAGGFSFELRRFGAGGILSNKVMAAHLAIPAYPLVLVAGLILTWRIRGWLRIKAPGVCSNCGYDLRATPERCPECGAERPHAV